MKTSFLTPWVAHFVCTAATVATAVALASCSTSPLGRKQLMIVPEAQMDAMGAQAFDQTKSQTPASSDPKWNSYVQCVVVPLTQAAQGQTDVKNWDIVVFNSPQVNAFALPGGHIGVYTGILKVAANDAQLAAVVGHEIGHVIARHGAERTSTALAAQGGLAAIGAVTGNNQTLMGLLGMGSQVGVLLPFSRTQESEADLIGEDLMARAGYDPHQSIELWHNMMAAGGNAPPAILSDHPSDPDRIASLQQHLPDAVAKYQAAQAAGLHPSCQRPAQ